MKGTHTHARTRARTRTHTLTNTHARTHAHTHTHARTHTHVRSYALIHKSKTHERAHTHSRVHAHTPHTHKHTTTLIPIALYLPLSATREAFTVPSTYRPGTFFILSENLSCTPRIPTNKGLKNVFDRYKEFANSFLTGFFCPNVAI